MSYILFYMKNAGASAVVVIKSRRMRVDKNSAVKNILFLC